MLKLGLISLKYVLVFHPKMMYRITLDLPGDGGIVIGYKSCLQATSCAVIGHRR